MWLTCWSLEGIQENKTTPFSLGVYACGPYPSTLCTAVPFPWEEKGSSIRKEPAGPGLGDRRVKHLLWPPSQTWPTLHGLAKLPVEQSSHFLSKSPAVRQHPTCSACGGVNPTVSVLSRHSSMRSVPCRQE